jgi:hypothetical protein
VAVMARHSPQGLAPVAPRPVVEEHGAGLPVRRVVAQVVMGNGCHNFGVTSPTLAMRKWITISPGMSAISGSISPGSSPGQRAAVMDTPLHRPRGRAAEKWADRAGSALPARVRGAHHGIYSQSTLAGSGVGRHSRVRSRRTKLSTASGLPLKP